MVTVQKIDVHFSTLGGLQGRPTARTCGPLLELPSIYELYLALFEEFSNVMKEEQACCCCFFLTLFSMRDVNDLK